jgi:excisionase family DNA binding protein
MNTAEVAKYLDVNEKKVYALVREAGLPATKATGKWLFPRELVDEWLVKATVNVGERASSKRNVLLMAGSNDPILESELASLGVTGADVLIYFANIGSLGGLKALQNGSADVAVAHLFDSTTGEYNTPFLDKDVRKRTLFLPFISREQGIMVRKGNPLGIQAIDDLAMPGVRFVNRQKGTGTRALFDSFLAGAGISSTRIVGYTRQARTHAEVALAVLRGTADAGLGVRSAAKMFGLDFIPLKKERFDILVSREASETRAFRYLLEDLKSERFKKAMADAGGYEEQSMELLPA